MERSEPGINRYHSDMSSFFQESTTYNRSCYSCEAMAYTTGQYTHQVQSGHGSGNIQISGDGSVTLNVENGHGITTRHYSPKSATASGSPYFIRQVQSDGDSGNIQISGDGIVTASEANGTTIRCTKSATARTGPPHYIHQVQSGGGSGNVQISGDGTCSVTLSKASAQPPSGY